MADVLITLMRSLFAFIDMVCLSMMVACVAVLYLYPSAFGALVFVPLVFLVYVIGLLIELIIVWVAKRTIGLSVLKSSKVVKTWSVYYWLLNVL